MLCGDTLPPPVVYPKGTDILASAEGQGVDSANLAAHSFVAGVDREELGSESHRLWRREMQTEAVRIFDNIFCEIEADRNRCHKVVPKVDPVDFPTSAAKVL